jgi:hypothetical protein
MLMKLVPWILAGALLVVARAIASSIPAEQIPPESNPINLTRFSPTPLRVNLPLPSPPAQVIVRLLVRQSSRFTQARRLALVVLSPLLDW